MSNRSIRSLLPLAAAALFSLSAGTSAFAADGQTTYRCSVLGDSAACAVLDQAPAGGNAAEVQPGSYARYLMHLGQSAEQAIAQARSVGEQPTLGVVERASASPASGREAYERMLGRTSSLEGRRTVRADAS